MALPLITPRRARSGVGVLIVIERVRLAPGLGGDVELVAVLVEGIDQRGDAGSAREHGAPLLERQIRGDHGGSMVMSPTDDVVEHVGGAAVARDIAQLVDLCAAAHNLTHVDHLVMWRTGWLSVDDAD